MIEDKIQQRDRLSNLQAFHKKQIVSIAFINWNLQYIKNSSFEICNIIPWCCFWAILDKFWLLALWCILVVNNIIGLICRICSKLIIKTLERRLLRSFYLLLPLNIFSLYFELLWLMLNMLMFAVSLPDLIAEPTVCRPLKILVILLNFLVTYVHVLLFYNICLLTYFHARIHQAINILLAFLVNTDYFW